MKNRLGLQLNSRKFTGKAFLVYFWGMPFLQSILFFYPDSYKYTMLLFIVAVSIMLLVENYSISLDKYIPVVGVFIIGSFYFICNAIFNNSHFVRDYYIYFILYGIMAMIAVTSINDIHKFLLYNMYCAAFVFLCYSLSPFIGFEKFGIRSYMNFGFPIALPAYLGLFMGRKIKKGKITFLIEIFCFFEIALYANRSCLLSIIVLWLANYILFVKKNGTQRIIIIVLSIIMMLGLIFFDSIVYYIDETIIKANDIDWRLWDYIITYVETKDLNSLFSGRIEIWQNAMTMIEQKPFFGWGVGAFENIYGEGVYTHNIFLEQSVEIGIVPTCVLTGFIIMQTINFFKKVKNKEVRYFMILFLVTIFPKLLLSSMYYGEISYWVFLLLLVNVNNYRKIGRGNTNE